MEKTKILAVTGPTATGKTKIGVELAESFSGEIISCDSMQIYKGLPIGTAQPTASELNKIKHHLVNFVEVSENFSVSDYVKLAQKAASNIAGRGKIPILVGGTGLYLRSMLQGTSFEDNHTDEEIRKSLYELAVSKGKAALYEQLLETDPRAAEKIHQNNVKRVVRAIEYNMVTGKLFSAQEIKPEDSEYDYLMLCLMYRDRDKLYAKIEHRVDAMLESGLLQEAREFHEFCAGCKVTPTAAQAIGYKEIFPYFNGAVSLETAVSNLKQATRRYAKRQITWFKRESFVKFIYLDDYSSQKEVFKECESLVSKFIIG